VVREPIERLKEKVLKENLWVFIFKLLSERDEYAYKLRKEIEKKFGFLAGNVTSYKVLYLLEKDGYVISYIKRNRVYYKLMTKGRKELVKAKNFFREIHHLL
jgi:DNA-binding PadR family transcriptional regulator